jgi:ribose 5-phosphate isomerase A
MPVPVEVLPFGRKLTMSRLAKLGGKPELRTEASGRPFITDNGNYVADVKFEKIPAPARLERVINQLPGVVENGIFAGAADVVVVGHAGGCTKLRNKKDFLNLMRKLKIG